MNHLTMCMESWIVARPVSSEGHRRLFRVEPAVSRADVCSTFPSSSRRDGRCCTHSLEQYRNTSRRTVLVSRAEKHHATRVHELPTVQHRGRMQSQQGRIPDARRCIIRDRVCRYHLHQGSSSRYCCKNSASRTSRKVVVLPFSVQR